MNTNYSAALGGAFMTPSHSGVVMLGDATGTALASSADNEFTGRFNGGFRMCITSTCATKMSFNATTAGLWAYTSDRNQKKDFKAIDDENILDQLSRLEISSWRYKSQMSKSNRNIGPMAQDFYKLVSKPNGLGSSETMINQNDVAGVTLVGVQVLERRTRELARENEILKKQIQEMNKKIEILLRK